MMYLTKKCLSFLNCQAVGIFRVLSITKLANTFESFTDIGKPFNYYLSFFLIVVYAKNSSLHVLTFFF